MTFVLLLMAFASPSLNAVGDAPIDRSTLRGLKSIAIVIDKIDPQLEGNGLNAGGLQSEIEDRLKSAGIPVDANAREFLGVKIWGLRPKKGGAYSLAIVLGLYQPVLLTRDQGIRTATETWEARTIILAQPKETSGSMLNAIDLLANQFIQAWKSVNP